MGMDILLVRRMLTLPSAVKPKIVNKVRMEAVGKKIIRKLMYSKPPL